MDRVTAARPWGRNNPRWTVFASGPLAELLPDAAIAARSYCVIWVADDPAENDAQPLRDGGPPALVERRQSGQSGPRRGVAARASLRALRAPGAP
jgi:hypothetical protein